MRRRRFLACSAVSFLAGCTALPNELPDAGGGVPAASVDATRVETYEDSWYAVVELSVEGRHPGDILFDVSLLDGEAVVETQRKLVPLAPSDRPLALRFPPVQQPIDEARVESVSEPHGPYQPVEGVSVGNVEASYEVGDGYSFPGVAADLENTGSSTVEFSPIPVALSGETVVNVGVADPLTLEPGERHRAAGMLYRAAGLPISDGEMYVVEPLE